MHTNVRGCGSRIVTAAPLLDRGNAGLRGRAISLLRHAATLAIQARVVSSIWVNSPSSFYGIGHYKGPLIFLHTASIQFREKLAVPSVSEEQHQAAAVHSHLLSLEAALAADGEDREESPAIEYAIDMCNTILWKQETSRPLDVEEDECVENCLLDYVVPEMKRTKVEAAAWEECIEVLKKAGALAGVWSGMGKLGNIEVCSAEGSARAWTGGVWF